MFPYFLIHYMTM